MTRTGVARAELSDSWDDVNDSHEEDHRPTRMNAGRRQDINDRGNDRGHARRRSLRSSVEPELVMPSSPDAGEAETKTSRPPRTSQPRFRLSDRSMTSDAGEIRKKSRATTPHFRMNERSLTSDAGGIRASKLQEMAEISEGEEEEESGSSLPGEVAGTAWRRVIVPATEYTVDVFGRVMRNAKPIIGYVVLAYLLCAAFVFFSGFISNSINNALSPVCRLPFLSHLSFCPPPNRPELQGSAEFGKLMDAQDAFQEILASSSTGVNLPLDMKRSEASIRDLKHVVEYSTLPSRNELVFEFTGFVDTARQASQDLSRFNSRIGRAVDRILSTNRWTLSVIDGVRLDEASKGAIARWIHDNLNVFAPFQPIALSRNTLLDQYLRHTSAVEEQIQSLIAEALALRRILENLDGRLDVIAGIAVRDGIKAEANRDELFAMLWTKVGGNRSSLTKVNQQLELLKNVSVYRRIAWGHVTSTLVKLQAIQHSLEDLRESVALPEIVGIERVPLEVHIESINLGIERLEQQREASRKIEADSYAKVTSRGEESSNKRAIGSKEL